MTTTDEEPEVVEEWFLMLGQGGLSGAVRVGAESIDEAGRMPQERGIEEEGDEGAAEKDHQDVANRVSILKPVAEA